MREWLSNQVLNHRWKKMLEAQTDRAHAQQKVFDLNRHLWGVKGQVAASLEAFLLDTPAMTAKDLPQVIERLPRRELEFIGLTSGTTSHRSKQVPITRGQAAAFKRFQLSVAAVVARNTAMRPLLDRRLSWGTCPEVERTSDNIPMGYISGYISQTGPQFLRRKSFPSPEVNLLTDMDRKLRALFEESRVQDIRCLTGVPSYVQNMMTHFADWAAREQGLTLSQLWPDLNTCVYSSASIAPYRDTIDRLVGRPLNYLGTYIATEGPFGLEMPELPGYRPGSYALNVEDILFGFEDTRTQTRLLWEELREGDEVEVLVAAPNGLGPYKVGDVLRVVTVHPYPQFEVLGRAGAMMNLAAEKMTESQLRGAVAGLKEQVPNLEHFYVYPAWGEAGILPRYDVVLVSDHSPRHPGALAARMDELMGEVNGDYAEARHETRVLGAPRLGWLPRQILDEEFRQKCAKGQFKRKHILSSAAELPAPVLRWSTAHSPQLEVVS